MKPVIDETNIYEKKLYDLRNLIELGISLSSNLDFESLVESILYSCIGQMFIEKVAIILQFDIDINNFYIHMSKGYDQEFDKSDIILNENSVLVKYLEKNPEPHRFDDLKNIELINAEASRLDVLNPEIIVPMISKDRINGILILGSKIDGGSFPQSEMDYLNYLAKFAAIAVENSRLYLMATLDRMTRLYTHHFFQERLLFEFKRSERYNISLSLIMMDIDHFKNFNDTYGHQQGDVILKELARLIRKNLRNVDIAARYGGEEFAVILPEIEFESAMVVAERLRNQVENFNFTGQKEPLHVTISLGVCEYDSKKDLEKDFLIKRADGALYNAKKSGRNRVAGCR